MCFFCMGVGMLLVVVEGSSVYCQRECIEAYTTKMNRSDGAAVKAVHWNPVGCGFVFITYVSASESAPPWSSW